MNLDNSIVTAILAVIGSGLIVGVVQWLKGILKIDGGWKAYVLTFIICAGATAYVLLAVTKAWGWLPFLGYTIATFGISSGLYTIGPKKTA